MLDPNNGFCKLKIPLKHSLEGCFYCIPDDSYLLYFSRMYNPFLYPAVFKERKMKDDKAVSRRKFLKIAGSIMGGGVLLCGGGAYLGLQTPRSVQFPQTTCAGGGNGRVLVAYASKCGSTGEIAARIADTLCAQDRSVDLSRARDVHSVDQYSHIVIGSAVYMGKVLDESLDFARKYLADLTGKRIALFNVSLTMKENTPENVQKAIGYLDDLREILTPDLVGTFAGRIDLDTLPFLYRQFAQADSEGILAEADYRDWEAIDAWTSNIV
jgi:menaquinone-dependent protoporphyrinogen oxidase